LYTLVRLETSHFVSLSWAMCFVIITINWAVDCTKLTIIISFLKDAFIGQLAVHVISIGYWAFNFSWFANCWADRVVWASSVIHSFCGWNTFLGL